MKKILNDFSFSPIIEEVPSLPVPGRYHSLITDFETKLVAPCFDDQDMCIMVRYLLINVSTFDVYDFTETYFPYKGNPRTDDFIAFLEYHGYDLASDNEIIGLKSTIEIVHEFIGGYFHPIISYRPWGRPKCYPENPDQDIPFYTKKFL